MDTRSSSRGLSGRVVAFTTHPGLATRVKKGTLPLNPLELLGPLKGELDLLFIAGEEWSGSCPGRFTA